MCQTGKNARRNNGEFLFLNIPVEKDKRGEEKARIEENWGGKVGRSENKQPREISVNRTKATGKIGNSDLCQIVILRAA